MNNQIIISEEVVEAIDWHIDECKTIGYEGDELNMNLNMAFESVFDETGTDPEKWEAFRSYCWTRV